MDQVVEPSKQEVPVRAVIPQGDCGGIGPEVALKTLAENAPSECAPLLLGHCEFLRKVARHCGLDLDLVSVRSAEEGFAFQGDGVLPVLELENTPATEPPGRPAASFGRSAVEGVLRGGELCLQERADLLVTPPIHKQSMHLAGYPFEGQTQILGELCRSRRYGMLACARSLRVLLATRHMSLRQALQSLDPQGVTKQLRIAHEAAREMLGISTPRIALAGLNPHAGEGGAFGDEEARILKPAIEKCREEYGFETSGPEVPDVVFKDAIDGKWDIVVALYHDQGFIPLKMFGRELAYTIFVGGSILRVSPMHGAAYDIAGKNVADPQPFAYALDRGLELARR